MENFKEIAEKCLRGELSGTFMLRNDARIHSRKLYRQTYSLQSFPYTFHSIPYTYSVKGQIFDKKISDFDIINFIPDMEERNVKLTLDKAKEWYKKGGELKEVALQAYKEEELKEFRPKSWKEYSFQMSKKLGFFIASDSSVQDYHYGCTNSEFDRNILPTKGLAEAFLAYMQLMSLRKAWIGEWEPDWNDDTDTNKFCIVVKKDSLKVISCCTISCPLSFPTLELANDFLGTFRELIEEAKPLF